MTKKSLSMVSLALMLLVVFTAFGLTAEEGKEKVTCPVTGQKILKADAVGPVTHDGENYYFCCEGCAKKFKENPEKYSLEKVLTDPVCGMAVDADSKHTSIQDGKKYHFCSEKCQSRFLKQSKSDEENCGRRRCGASCKRECCQPKESDK